MLRKVGSFTTAAILFLTQHSLCQCPNEKLQIAIVASRGAEIDSVFFKRLPDEVKILTDTTNKQYGTTSVAMVTYGSTDSKVVQGFTTKSTDFSKVTVQTEPVEKVSLSESLKAVAKFASDATFGWEADASKHIIWILSIPPKEAKVIGNDQSQNVWEAVKKQGISLHLVVERHTSQRFLSAWLEQLAKNLNTYHVRTYDKSKISADGFLVLDLSSKKCRAGISGRSIPQAQCSAEHSSKLKLQVTFLVDRTASFQPFFKQFGPGANKLVRDIVAYFPGSEFALASFCDYKISQMVNGDEDSNSIADERNGCYGVFQKMTDDPEEFERSMVGMKVCEGGDFPECILTALLFTAVDTHLGWTHQPKDKNGTVILRLIILLTDTDSHLNSTIVWKDGKKRHNPKGDGTDTCENSFAPSESLVSSRLAQKGIHVIGFITHGALSYWKKMFGSSFKGIKNTLYEMDFNSIKDLAPEIKKAITADVACGEEWEDPPGFNLLGL